MHQTVFKPSISLVSFYIINTTIIIIRSLFFFLILHGVRRVSDGHSMKVDWLLKKIYIYFSPGGYISVFYFRMYDEAITLSVGHLTRVQRDLNRWIKGGIAHGSTYLEFSHDRLSRHALWTAEPQYNITWVYRWSTCTVFFFFLFFSEIITSQCLNANLIL